MITTREAVRAVILTPEREVLLLRIRPPGGDASFWITPGGGLEPGEDVETGLRRELKEELGLESFAMGPLVWLRQHTFTWAGKRICQRERYHVIHATRFVPLMSDAEEAKVLDRFHWWPARELAHAGERLTPLSLARIISGFLTHGPPTTPLEPEILVD